MKLTQRQLKKIVKQELRRVLNEQNLQTDPDGPQTMMGTGHIAAIAGSRGLNNVAGDLEDLAVEIQRAVSNQDNQKVLKLATRVRRAGMDLYNIVMAAKSEASGDEGTYQMSPGSKGGRYTSTSDVKYDSGGRPM